MRRAQTIVQSGEGLALSLGATLGFWLQRPRGTQSALTASCALWFFFTRKPKSQAKDQKNWKVVDLKQLIDDLPFLPEWQ